MTTYRDFHRRSLQDRAGFDRLLALFELEKLVYELRYEARNRPDWASIPIVGMLRMLETAA